MDLSKLSVYIQDNWLLNNITLHLLQNKGGRLVYKINSEQGTYVLKISNSAKKYKEMVRDLWIIESEQRQMFANVPKILKTKYSNTIISYEGRYGFIMEYIDGGNPDGTREDWKEIALLTAQLHEVKNCKYVTDLTLNSEKAWIEEQSQRFSFGQEYKNLFYKLIDFSVFPQTFIHTDIGLHNCVKNKKGEIFFLDWDGAGVGARILDISFPLLSQLISINWFIQEKNIKIFYKTYFENTHIPVLRKEKEAIFDASLFFSLIYVPYGDIQKNWAKVKYAIKNKDYLLSLILD